MLARATRDRTIVTSRSNAAGVTSSGHASILSQATAVGLTTDTSGVIVRRAKRYALIAEAARISTGYEFTQFDTGMAFALRSEVGRPRYRRWEKGLSILNDGSAFGDEDSSPRHRDFVTAMVAIDLYLFERRHVVVVCETLEHTFRFTGKLLLIARALMVQDPQIVNIGNDERSVMAACCWLQLDDRSRESSGITVLPALNGPMPFPRVGGILIARASKLRQDGEFWRRTGRAHFPDGP